MGKSIEMVGNVIRNRFSINKNINIIAHLAIFMSSFRERTKGGEQKKVQRMTNDEETQKHENKNINFPLLHTRNENVAISSTKKKQQKM